MKRHTPEYHQHYITYWPSFVGGIGFLCLCGVVLLLFISCCIVFWVDATVSSGTKYGFSLATIALGFLMVFIVRWVRKFMFCCITVTHDGFSITNETTKSDITIKWGQVASITFVQDHYRGRKHYRVCPKPALQMADIVLPISMVDEEKLHTLIPSKLLTNPTAYMTRL